jgi:hypothetical protein
VNSVLGNLKADPSYTVKALDYAHVEYLLDVLKTKLPFNGSKMSEQYVEDTLVNELILRMSETLNGATPAHTHALQAAVRLRRLEDVKEHWVPVVRYTLVVLVAAQVLTLKDGKYSRGPALHTSS